MHIFRETMLVVQKKVKDISGTLDIIEDQVENSKLVHLLSFILGSKKKKKKIK
jgi:hypothetical protein